MASLLDRSRGLWEWARRGATRLPTRVTIDPDHVLDQLGPVAPGTPFVPGGNYFQVRVNEMFLADTRQWFTKYDPSLLFVTEFVYDKRVEAVPFVVGSAMLDKYGQMLPAGMLFADTRVAGLHPYRGGRLTLAVVLCRVQKVNYARELLGVAEKVSVLGAGAGMGTYLKVAELALDGIESLLGLEALEPITGYRKEFDPDAGEELRSTFFALVDAEEELSADRFWVRDGRLFHGTTAEDARPFRSNDYVLYSLVADAERTDEVTLPFYPLWERDAEEAMSSGKGVDDPAWRNAKAAMTTLVRSVTASPDLTKTQAEALIDKYTTQMVALRDRSVRLASLGTNGPADRAADALRTRAASILDL